MQACVCVGTRIHVHKYAKYMRVFSAFSALYVILRAFSRPAKAFACVPVCVEFMPNVPAVGLLPQAKTA